MAPLKMTTTRTKHRIVSPAEKRTQVRVTVDFKFTKTHFNQLFAVLKIRNKNGPGRAHHYEFQKQGRANADSCVLQWAWLDIPFRSIDTSFVFPLTHEIADEQERIGGEILGGVNKSKALRVMVAYFETVYKLNPPVQSKFA
jgi:hypothetical protein